MSMIDWLLDYLRSSSYITTLVIVWLSFYFLATFWSFFYKYISINAQLNLEKQSLETLMMGGNALNSSSALYKCFNKNRKITENLLSICVSKAIKDATSGLTFLSIVASTAPFIGLFGTVVSILESFSTLGATSKASLDVIAPVISEALVATAAGIMVAIPAYSFHLLLKRKAFELDSYLKIITSLILERTEKQKKEGVSTDTEN